MSKSIFFDDKFDRHITAMRLNFYILSRRARPAPGQFACWSAYRLWGVHDPQWRERPRGVRDSCQRWTLDFPSKTDPETFCRQHWRSSSCAGPMTAGFPTLTASRNPAGHRWHHGQKRLSIAFFQQPNYDALIECICPPGKAKHPSVRSGEYRDLKYRQTTVGGGLTSAQHNSRRAGLCVPKTSSVLIRKQHRGRCHLRAR